MGCCVTHRSSPLFCNTNYSLTGSSPTQLRSPPPPRALYRVSLQETRFRGFHPLIPLIWGLRGSAPNNGFPGGEGVTRPGLAVTGLAEQVRMHHIKRFYLKQLRSITRLRCVVKSGTGLGFIKLNYYLFFKITLWV